MEIIKGTNVEALFDNYPEDIRVKLLCLRQLVIDTALEIDEVNELEEVMKWGEPSYLTIGGSTIRMNWKRSNPDQYAIYFHCKTTLVETFKELYGDIFKYEGNRAIVFYKNDEIPIEELKYCILLSLTYHRRKHLPLLGA